MVQDGPASSGFGGPRGEGASRVGSFFCDSKSSGFRRIRDALWIVCVWPLPAPAPPCQHHNCGSLVFLVILISDAFVQHMMKLDQGMEIESETNDSKVKCKYGNNLVLCDASKHCSE